jgi:nitric oxide reductase large subunit
VPLTNRLLAITLFYYRYNRSIFWFNGSLLILRIIQDPLFKFVNDYSSPFCKLLIFIGFEGLLKHEETNSIIEDFKVKKTTFLTSKQQKKDAENQLNNLKNQINEAEKRKKVPKSDTIAIDQEIENLQSQQAPMISNIQALTTQLDTQRQSMDTIKKALITAYQNTHNIQKFLNNLLLIVGIISLVLILFKFFQGMNKNNIKENLLINVLGNFHSPNSLIWAVAYHIASIPFTVLTIYGFLINNKTVEGFLEKIPLVF